MSSKQNLVKGPRLDSNKCKSNLRKSRFKSESNAALDADVNNIVKESEEGELQVEIKNPILKYNSEEKLHRVIKSSIEIDENIIKDQVRVHGHNSRRKKSFRDESRAGGRSKTSERKRVDFLSSLGEQYFDRKSRCRGEVDLQDKCRFILIAAPPVSCCCCCHRKRRRLINAN